MEFANSIASKSSGRRLAGIIERGLVQFKVEEKRLGLACVGEIASGFQLQYTDRTNQSAADSVSEPAPLIDHVCLL